MNELEVPRVHAKSGGGNVTSSEVPLGPRAASFRAVLTDALGKALVVERDGNLMRYAAAVFVN
jgi:hypothetical protein